METFNFKEIKALHELEERGEYFTIIDTNGACDRLSWIKGNKHWKPAAHKDRAKLIAKIERLQAEVERLKTTLARSCEDARDELYGCCPADEKLQAKLDLINAIIFGSKHADIDKLEQIEFALTDTPEAGDE